MTAPLSPQQSALLALVPVDGSSIGNNSLRKKLDWTEAAYTAVRDALVVAGQLEKGKGRGGSVRRSVSAASKTELFAPEEVESVLPELDRARRAVSQISNPKPENTKPTSPITEHRYTEATRKNLPTAGDALGHVEEEAQITYAYDPHRSPVLRFNGGIVRLRAVLQEARRRPMTEAESTELAALLESPQPWLEWTGKREQPDFSVEPVALHIHERVSAQAILRAVRREDIQRDLFADATQSAREARAYYQHDVAWANRLITGDSLQVMTSLARREGLAGQVQMIYFDPPYGIKFSSNWQNEVGKRDVKDKDEDLTREPEMIRAYRDTWTLGVHSYLAYLKQRLIVGRELLKDTGSIFVQISDENLHRVRTVMDEVFGAENFCSVISFATTTGFSTKLLANVVDHVLWYSKDIAKVARQFKQLYRQKIPGEEGATKVRPLWEVHPDLAASMNGATLGVSDQFTSQGAGSTEQEIEVEGKKFSPPAGLHWKTTVEGSVRLARALRLKVEGDRPRYVRLMSDFDQFPIANVWMDIGGVQNRTQGKLYVVQTAEEVVTRCMLMWMSRHFAAIHP